MDRWVHVYACEQQFPSALQLWLFEQQFELARSLSHLEGVVKVPHLRPGTLPHLPILNVPSRTPVIDYKFRTLSQHIIYGNPIITQSQSRQAAPSIVDDGICLGVRSSRIPVGNHFEHGFEPIHLFLNDYKLPLKYIYFHSHTQFLVLCHHSNSVVMVLW
jgi:hypothetical protein